MVRKIDRTGEEGYNSFGSKMVIKEYRNKRDIDVYFPKYNWTFKHAAYNTFKNGNIKCPYERRTFGVGFLGEGKYKMSENGKLTDVYIIWSSMLKRCYDPKYQEKHTTYKGCRVEDYLLNFQHMGEWLESNYYEVPGEKMCLDKDILIKGNKVYSPETCIFVPNNINVLFTKREKDRGKYPIGIRYCERDNALIVGCSVNGKMKHLGYFKSNEIEKAFNCYKAFKEKYITQIADEYKDLIPKELYEALYKYEVEIND